MARHPAGHTEPAWLFGDLFLWGFTAYLTDALLKLGGWSQPVGSDPARRRPQALHAGPLAALTRRPRGGQAQSSLAGLTSSPQW